MLQYRRHLNIFTFTVCVSNRNKFSCNCCYEELFDCRVIVSKFPHSLLLIGMNHVDAEISDIPDINKIFNGDTH
jgi:hypothetical protein